MTVQIGDIFYYGLLEDHVNNTKVRDQYINSFLDKNNKKACEYVIKLVQIENNKPTINETKYIFEIIKVIKQNYDLYYDANDTIYVYDYVKLPESYTPVSSIEYNMCTLNLVIPFNEYLSYNIAKPIIIQNKYVKLEINRDSTTKKYYMSDIYLSNIEYGNQCLDIVLCKKHSSFGFMKNEEFTKLENTEDDNVDNIVACFFSKYLI